MQKFFSFLDPELAHNLSIKFLSTTGSSPFNILYKQALNHSPVSVMGIDFRNKIGLAAGLDKNGEAIDAFDAMGFGYYIISPSCFSEFFAVAMVSSCCLFLGLFLIKCIGLLVIY